MLSQRAVELGSARSVIRELFEYGNQRAKSVGTENVFDFSIGNPSVPPPPLVNETAIRLLRESDPVRLHGYTSAGGDAQARAKIAASLSRRFGGSYTVDNLYLTVGAAAALCCCLHGLCRPGDEVVVFAPYFPEYKVFIEGAGASMTLIPADVDSFQINFQALETALTPYTQAVIINSPNNPCGVVYSADTLTRLAGLLEVKSAEYGHPIYIISDEPYREIVYNGIQTPWVPDFYPNTLVCYSWSKSLSLPGQRIGYVLVPGTVEDWQSAYAAVAGAGRMLGYVNAPALFQRVAAACCDQTSDLSVYAQNRHLLLNGLRELGFTCVEPEGTFYLFPRTLEPDDAAFCQAAQALDLLIVPGSGFGCPGHARISYCVPTERIRRALPIFEKLAEQYVR